MDINERLSTRNSMNANPQGFEIDEEGAPIDPAFEGAQGVPIDTPINDIDPLGEDMLGADPAGDATAAGAMDVVGDLGQGLLKGAAKGFEQINKAVPGLSFMQDQFGKLFSALGIDSSVDEPTTLPGKLVEGVSQALPGIIPGVKVARTLIGTSTAIRRIGAEVVGGTLGDFFTSGTDEAEGLVELIKLADTKTTDKVATALEEFLAEGKNDPSEFRARVLGSVPGAILGPLLEPLIELGGAALKSGSAKEVIDLIDELKRDESGTVNIPTGGKGLVSAVQDPVTGKVFTGTNHGTAYNDAIEGTVDVSDEFGDAPIEGYVKSDGEFITREVAEAPTSTEALLNGMTDKQLKARTVEEFGLSETDAANMVALDRDGLIVELADDIDRGMASRGEGPDVDLDVDEAPTSIKPTTPTTGQVNMRISQLTLENDIRNGTVSDVPNVDPEEIAVIQSRLNADDIASVEEVTAILNTASEQMELPIDQRIQPSGGNKLLDDSVESYEVDIPEQIEVSVPRTPEGKALPKKGRNQILVDRKDEIANVLAERMRPHLGSFAQFFYHTGPMVRKAVELGIPEEEAREQLEQFALAYAATSPRTSTTSNLRNASLVRAKETIDQPLDSILGPGTGGISERGYAMMIGEGGIHRQLIEAVQNGGIDINTNPKPFTFAENVRGNLDGVTVDTHAIRAVMDVLNELEPGSIPDTYIKPKYRAGYKADPSSLDPALHINDKLNGELIDGVKTQTEYAQFSDIYRRASEILNVQPAEAQSLGWFGSGDRTGLTSEPKTIVQLIEDRVDVTAQATGIPKVEVFRKFMKGQIPLLSLGGFTLLGAGANNEQIGEPDG